jgi:hypothetical protein
MPKLQAPQNPRWTVGNSRSGAAGAEPHARLGSASAAAAAAFAESVPIRNASNSASDDPAASRSLDKVRRDGLPWRLRSDQIVRLTPAFTAQALAVMPSGLNLISSSRSSEPSVGI